MKFSKLKQIPFWEATEISCQTFRDTLEELTTILEHKFIKTISRGVS